VETKWEGVKNLALEDQSSRHQMMERLLGSLACSSRSNGWRACSSLLHRTQCMEGAPHDAEAMDVEEFTMEGSVEVKIGTILVK